MIDFLPIKNSQAEHASQGDMLGVTNGKDLRRVVAKPLDRITAHTGHRGQPLLGSLGVDDLPPNVIQGNRVGGEEQRLVIPGGKGGMPGTRASLVSPHQPVQNL